MQEVKIQVSPDQAELIDEFLIENEVEDWHLYVEPHTRQASLTSYFGDEPAARAAWEDLKENLPAEIETGQPEFRPLEDREWQESYKAHFHKWHFDGLHWAPVWERDDFRPPEGEEVVWLDPGMAFGTGNHETTRLCVERMVEAGREWRAEGRDPAQLEVLDAGCGSGILAISAVKCGFGTVAGFDLDPVAVEVSQANAELNGVAGQIEFFEGDLVTGLPGRAADLLIANIQADVLGRHAGELAAALKPGGRLVLSGILAAELTEVEECFQRVLPDAAFSSHQLGEWADLVALAPRELSPESADQ